MFDPETVIIIFSGSNIQQQILDSYHSPPIGLASV